MKKYVIIINVRVIKNILRKKLIINMKLKKVGQKKVAEIIQKILTIANNQNLDKIKLIKYSLNQFYKDGVDYTCFYNYINKLGYGQAIIEFKEKLYLIEFLEHLEYKQKLKDSKKLKSSN